MSREEDRSREFAQGGTPTMRGEYCTAVGPNGETCIFGRGHAVGYHLTPGSRPGEAERWTGPAGTLSTADDALSLMRELAKSSDWVSVFWDRGWGDGPLEISIIVGGNGQEPRAFITPDVYRDLRMTGAIEPNSLQTFKARRLHDYRPAASDT